MFASQTVRRAAIGATLALALLVPACAPPRTSVAPTPTAAPTSAAGVCALNLKAMGVSLSLYARDAGGQYPLALSGVTPLYIKALPTCPAAKADTYTAGYTAVGNAYTLTCKGSSHTTEGLTPDQPSVSSATGVAPASLLPQGITPASAR